MPSDSPLNQAEIHILVGLLVGRERAVSLHVGDTGVSRQVVLLHVLQKLREAAVVVRAVFLVDIVGHDREGRQTVEPRAPLVARAHIVAQLPVDLHPRDQVLNARKAAG